MINEKEHYKLIERCYNCDGNDHSCDYFTPIEERMNCGYYYTVANDVRKIDDGERKILTFPVLVEIRRRDLEDGE